MVAARLRHRLGGAVVLAAGIRGNRVAALRRHAEPTLLVQGSDDELVGSNALRRLFDASAANVKRRHVVDGAGHDDLWPRGGDALKVALRAFLDAL